MVISFIFKQLLRNRKFKSSFCFYIIFVVQIFFMKLFKAIAFAICSLPFLLFAQNINYGSWKVEGYATNVTKITHNPYEYSKSYNVTNAVIAKPVATIKPNYSFGNGGAILLNNRTISITPSSNNEGYYCLGIALQKDEQIKSQEDRLKKLEELILNK